jgi:hypothetical protein
VFPPRGISPGLTLAIVDPDVDYTGIEIQVCNARFAGSARAYARFHELTDFAAQLIGFPRDHSDQRIHEFGGRGPRTAGGYCRVQFRCSDRAGHIALQIGLEEEDGWWGRSSVQMTLQVEAAEIDRFIESLRTLDRERSGTAVLASL